MLQDSETAIIQVYLGLLHIKILPIQMRCQLTHESQ